MSDAALIWKVISSRKNTIREAHGLAPLLAPGSLVLVDGPLGAGKTFFVRALLRALGVPPKVPVPSPTFSLVHRYEVGSQCVLHADLYRLRDEPDAGGATRNLGLRDERADGAILLVEWGAGLELALGGPAERIVHLARSAAGRRLAISPAV